MSSSKVTVKLQQLYRAAEQRRVSLDVYSPLEVPDVLDDAAALYRDTVDNIDAVSVPGASKVWEELATVLDKASKQCQRVLQRHKLL